MQELLTHVIAASKTEQTAAVPASAESAPALRRGWLRNGNRPGDFHNCARCSANTRQGTPCRAPAMANGRCRMHGGKSTGPRTTQGRARCAEAHTVHGLYEKQLVEKVRVSSLSMRACAIASDLRSRELVRLAASVGIDISSLAPPEISRLNVRKQVAAAHRTLTKLWAIASFRNSHSVRQRRAVRRNLAEVAQKLARLRCKSGAGRKRRSL